MVQPQLHTLVDDRTRELETLLEVSNEVSSTLDLDTLLSTVFARLERIVPYDGASISLIEGEDTFLLLNWRLPAAGPPVRHWVADERGEEALGQLFQLRTPVIIPDVCADTPEAAVWRDNAMRSGRGLDGVRTWMGIPLLAAKRNIGMLTLEHQESDFYTPYHAEITLALANQVAVAIANARLFRAVQRGAEQFRVISELGQHITSILDVDELLSQAVSLIRDAFGYYHVHIGLIDGELVRLSSHAGVFEDEPGCRHCSTLQLRVGQEAICSMVVDSGAPILVPDISREPRYLHPGGATGSGIVVPLQVKGRVIGLLDVEHREVNALTQNDVAVLQLLANQIAVAIENSRLYTQAQALAALQERQKLARELHDSVSQALYGIGLGTKTALRLVEDDETDKAALAQPLEYVVTLATSALAEMRALIFELRPESLEVEGLVPSLVRRLDAVKARGEIDVQASYNAEPDLTVAAKEVLYRVLQEGLHNVLKHAQARHLAVSLAKGGEGVTLEIRDDGSGFELREQFPGHLGLQSMRERVEGIGGVFLMESAPGQGTLLRATVPHPQEPARRSAGQVT